MTTQLDATGSKAAYVAAHDGAVIVDRSSLGHLIFRGETRLDLIHRMSTQAVVQLEPGEGAATILTTDVGRIIDRLLLYASEDSVLVVTGEDNAEDIARYLMRFVFFNDDFHIEDLSAVTGVVGVYGSQAAERLGAAIGAELDLTLHYWRQAALGSCPVTIHRTDPVAGDGYLVLVSLDRLQETWEALITAGMVPIEAADFEYLRIESGLARFGRELTQEYIPLEADLWADVSFSKGCYIGQEIIARMESRGRLAKRLARLRLAGPVASGSQLTIDGKPVGTITSVSKGPADTQALAYLKTSASGMLDRLTVAGELVTVLSSWARSATDS